VDELIAPLMAFFNSLLALPLSFYGSPRIQAFVSIFIQPCRCGLEDNLKTLVRNDGAFLINSHPIIKK
jgi:hypothetical protein